MDSKHRHELQANELERVTLTASHSLGSLFDRYGNQVAIGICVVAVLSSAYIYWTRSTSVKVAGSWMSLSSSQAAADYADVSDRYKGTPAAVWAQLKEGDTRLREGIELAFTDRAAANVELKKAKEAYAAAAAGSTHQPMIRERAMFGLARCLEAQCSGDTGEVVKAYEDLLKAFPNSIYKKDVEEQITLLKTGGTQEFYAWFSKQNPKPAIPKKPADRVLGDDLDMGGPALSAPMLPDPGLKAPSPKSLSPKGPSLPIPELPDPSSKSDTDETKTSKKDSPKARAIPEEEAPATDKPTLKAPEPDKPTTDKPATEQPDTEKPEPEKKTEAEKPAEE